MMLSLALVCLGVGLAIGNPVPSSNTMTPAQLEDYFNRFGYMGELMPDPEIAELATTNKSMAMEYAIRIFQKRYSAYGLQETGVLDDDTRKLIEMPRCGMKDILDMKDTGMKIRNRRYTITGAKWEKNDLSYKITAYPRDYDLSVDQVDREVRRAFQVWENVTPLTFRRIEYRSIEVPDIEIKFSPSWYYDHGDGYPFDGPSGTLAHAFFPNSPIFRGDAHFDEAEQWTIDTDRGINFFLVAAHEFGHSLGLAHSQDPSALMAPFYAGYKENFQLPYDDIMGIQALYGPPNPSNTPIPPVTSVPPTMMPGGNDICNDASFDAITTVVTAGNEKKIYGFSGAHFVLIETDGTIASGYPQLISEGWPGLPNDIDAALFYDKRWVWYTRENKWIQGYPATFIIKGNQYWRVEDKKVLIGPRPLTDLAWNFPNDIDSAMVGSTDEITYLFKGDQYYKFTEWNGILPGFPKPISEFNVYIESVDAAMQTPAGENVLFKGSQHYSLDDNYQVKTGYPRHNSVKWFKCPTTQTQEDGNDDNDDEQRGPDVNVRDIGRS